MARTPSVVGICMIGQPITIPLAPALILYPQTQFMGTGDIPSRDGYPASNALWVFDNNMWQPRPDT